MAYLRGFPVDSVVVAGYSGVTWYQVPHSRLSCRGAVSVAGMEAEWLWSGRYDPPLRVCATLAAVAIKVPNATLQRWDLYQAYSVFRELHPRRRMGATWRAWLQDRRLAVRRELSDHRPALDALAAELLQRRTLTGAQVEAIIAAKLPECAGAACLPPPREDLPSGCPETRRTEEHE